MNCHDIPCHQFKVKRGLYFNVTLALTLVSNLFWYLPSPNTTLTDDDVKSGKTETESKSCVQNTKSRLNSGDLLTRYVCHLNCLSSK